MRRSSLSRGKAFGVRDADEVQAAAGSANALRVISPYRFGGTWVFDDEAVGLLREPFVAGIPEMIDRQVGDAGLSGRPFQVVFSAGPFPGALRLVRQQSEMGGFWYSWEETRMKGWLCPALFRYFPEAPAELWVKIERGS